MQFETTLTCMRLVFVTLSLECTGVGPKTLRSGEGAPITLTRSIGGP